MGSNYTSLTQTGVLSSDINFNGNLDLGAYNLTTTGTLTGSNIKNLLSFNYGLGGFTKFHKTVITDTETTYQNNNYDTLDSTLLTTATDDFFIDGNYDYLVYGGCETKNGSSGNNPDVYYATSETADKTTNVITDVQNFNSANYIWHWNLPVLTNKANYGDTIYSRLYHLNAGQIITIKNLFYEIFISPQNPFTISDLSAFTDSLIGIILYDAGDIVKLNDTTDLYYSGVATQEIYINLEDLTITKCEIISGNPRLIFNDTR